MRELYPIWLCNAKNLPTAIAPGLVTAACPAQSDDVQTKDII